ncbi:ATP-binding protein [Deinococcus frigens]|uniref:ATP-binding protein n=1 Tax=Deinococcus frigens TaxID=249403 RepID=UPI0004979AA4|nr:ATP-binding protein [Deinococcus frigens]
MTQFESDFDPMLDALIGPDSDISAPSVPSPPMTPELAQAAHAHLAQARANDRARHPKPRETATVAGVLGKFTPALPPAAEIYPTAGHMDALARIRSMPRFVAAVRRRLHDDSCMGGDVVITAGPGAYDNRRCPHCEVTGRETRLRAQLRSSGIEGRYLDSEWADLELLAPLDRVAEKCADIDALISAGVSLLLYSEQTGCGKSQAAMLIAKAAIRAGHDAQVVNLARLALDVREGFSNRGGEGTLTERAALLRMTTPALLVIDDLGASEGETAAIERRLLGLALDERQMHRRATVVTTNLPLTVPEGSKAATLGSIFGARVLARLQPLTALHVNHGVNFRARKSEVSW